MLQYNSGYSTLLFSCCNNLFVSNCLRICILLSLLIISFHDYIERHVVLKLCTDILCDCLDPEVHPQPEEYWGRVNPIGPRACHDEGKRISETLSYAYEKQVICLFFVNVCLFYISVFCNGL